MLPAGAAAAHCPKQHCSVLLLEPSCRNCLVSGRLTCSRLPAGCRAAEWHECTSGGAPVAGATAGISTRWRRHGSRRRSTVGRSANNARTASGSGAGRGARDAGVTATGARAHGGAPLAVVQQLGGAQRLRQARCQPLGLHGVQSDFRGLVK